MIWSGAKDYDYSVFIFKTRIEVHLNLAVGDGEKNISLDSCHLTELLVSGNCKKIDLFKTTIGLFSAEYCKCQQFEVSDSKIEQYALFKFEAYEVNFDTVKLAIIDMTRFKARSKQTTKEVSESYHRMVLKTTRSVKAAAEVNCQLTRATSTPIIALFGYFSGRGPL